MEIKEINSIVENIITNSEMNSFITIKDENDNMIIMIQKVHLFNDIVIIISNKNDINEIIFESNHIMDEDYINTVEDIISKILLDMKYLVEESNLTKLRF